MAAKRAADPTYAQVRPASRSQALKTMPRKKSSSAIGAKTTMATMTSHGLSIAIACSAGPTGGGLPIRTRSSDTRNSTIVDADPGQDPPAEPGDDRADGVTTGEGGQCGERLRAVDEEVADDQQPQLSRHEDHRRPEEADLALAAPEGQRVVREWRGQGGPDDERERQEEEDRWTPIALRWQRAADADLADGEVDEAGDERQPSGQRDEAEQEGIGDDEALSAELDRDEGEEGDDDATDVRTHPGHLGMR